MKKNTFQKPHVSRGAKCVAVVLLTAAMFSGLCACFEHQGTDFGPPPGRQTEAPSADRQTANAAVQETATAQETEAVQKTVYYEIVNVSGASWVMDFSTDPAYFDDLDGIDVSGFTVPPDGSLLYKFNVEDGTHVDALDALTELSPTTYTITLTCAAGPKPSDNDEEYVYLNPLYGQTAYIYYITIDGTYGKCAVIEWDGAAFTQVS